MNNPSCQRDAGWAPGGLRTATPVEVCRLKAKDSHPSGGVQAGGQSKTGLVYRC